MDQTTPKKEGSLSLEASNVHQICAQSICESSSEVGHSTATEGSGFFSLPGELRNMIYKHVLIRPASQTSADKDNGIAEGGTIRAYSGRDWGDQKAPPLSFLYVNKQIHEEAMGVLGTSSDAEAKVEVRLGDCYPNHDSGVAFHAAQHNALENFVRVYITPDVWDEGMDPHDNTERQLAHLKRHIEIFVAASALYWKGAKRYATVDLQDIVTPPLYRAPKPSPKDGEEEALYDKIVDILKLMHKDEATQWTVVVMGGQHAPKNMNTLKVACEELGIIFKNRETRYDVM
ncbi:uncharacterized protein BDZ99DRAFT_483735 [Mytilinidion resinicola]|uniref:Uncharacterized protein n=1 Tax=Mytilinidion resinicola TaxID=574789 RepID=A0A6A6Y117_9PEZI|nr:uncharacterized protein BDZ99DRAFT_483735 [Mytilinidion resinicola]KAF2801507.1 hypothetical protein BDZ99DRAFT_483735 [Mytilinidion resinicola]